MKWEPTPLVKFYEALGSVADGRVHVKGNTAKVYSSTGNKYYDINYDPDKGAIMANDNSSYWKGYLGYPAIAFLMQTGVISYDEKVGALLKDIPWKDINQKFKNDFETALEFILSNKSDQEKAALHDAVLQASQQLTELNLTHLGPKTQPPSGY